MVSLAGVTSGYARSAPHCCEGGLEVVDPITAALAGLTDTAPQAVMDGDRYPLTPPIDNNHGRGRSLLHGHATGLARWP